MAIPLSPCFKSYVRSQASPPVRLDDLLQKLTSLDNKFHVMAGGVSALENPVNPTPAIIPHASGLYPPWGFLNNRPAAGFIERKPVAPHHAAKSHRSSSSMAPPYPLPSLRPLAVTR